MPKKRTAPPQVPVKIPQKHGGALLSGGVPGNRGGGTLPSAVRAACREGFAQAINTVIDIAKGEADGVAPGEQVRAFDVLGKYGMGELKAVLPEEFCEAAAYIFAKYVPADQVEAAIGELLERLKGE